MKTPKEFINNLNNKIITESMLEQCLFSVNKRAKNYRDKVKEYRKEIRNNYYLYDKYNYIEKYTVKKEEYYEYKEILLTLLKPKCIHFQKMGYKRKRIYDYEKEFKEINKEKIVWRNSFYNHEEEREVKFVDIETSEEIFEYYLFYKTTNYSFHQPIQYEDLNKYDLELIEIKNLVTKGKYIQDLVSAQFVKKVIELIKSKEYTYID